MNEKPKLSKPYAVFALTIMAFFGGVVVGQGEASGVSPFFCIVGAVWLAVIGTYETGKAIGRNDPR